MLFDRFDREFYAIYFDPLQQFHQFLAGLGRKAARAAVGHEAGLIHRAEIPAGGHIVWTQVKINAERFQHASPDLIVDRVIAKNGEMPGTAARGYPRPHRDGQPQDRLSGQRIQVGSAGRLQFCLPARLLRQPAQAVQNDHCDFRLRRHDQILQKPEIHELPPLTRVFRLRSGSTFFPVPNTSRSYARLVLA